MRDVPELRVVAFFVFLSSAACGAPVPEVVMGGEAVLPVALARAADSFASVLAVDEKADVSDVEKAALHHAAKGSVALFMPRCARHLEVLRESYSEVDYLASEEGKGMLGVAVASHFAQHCSSALGLSKSQCDGLAVSLAALVDSGSSVAMALVPGAAPAGAAPNQSQPIEEQGVVAGVAQRSHGGEWCLELWRELHAAKDIRGQAVRNSSPGSKSAANAGLVFAGLFATVALLA